MALMLDNASNNDTLVDNLVNLANGQGLLLDKAWAQLRCLPHTIHLATLKVSNLPDAGQLEH
jgi:hypothetical protein